ncbi:MAG: hypothetical protein IT380_13095 [Myxococcales bacterium]|nr:hypothetical protein [Myxococcales bacterium]
MSPEREQRFWEGVERAGRFFMGDSPVQRAMLDISKALKDAGIPHAILGAMALNEYGYLRMTTDVDILLSAEGLRRFKELHLGRGYVEKFPGSKGVRDSRNGVSIDILLAGEFPGDGKPKPVRFPDPALAAVAGERVCLLPLEKLLELKLASGLSAPHRLKDLADVLEVIKALALPEDVASRLDPSVRAKYLELWAAAQVKDPYSDG